MNKSRYDNSVIDVVRLIAEGQRFLAGVTDLLIDELTSTRDVGIMTVGLEWDAGDGYTFTGANMDTTVSGKSVGDVVVIEVGPATDAKGRPVGDVSGVTFEVSDPAILGLEIDPADVTPLKGKRACRVTILDTGDATLTATEQRPTKGPLTATVHFTATAPESLDQATDLPIEVEPDAAAPSVDVTTNPTPQTGGRADRSRTLRGTGF